MSKNLSFRILAVIVLAGIGIFLFYRYTNNTTKAKNFIERIREENKAGFDSLQNAINYENNLNYRIEKSITEGDFKTAYPLMDSLPAFGKKHSIHLYQGMIYEKQKKYTEAIQEYTTVIDAEPFPLALNKRAEVYIKINRLNFALNDYKKAASLNYDYSLQVANTFMLMNKKDSALKYYQIYLEHYPNDTAVQQKIKKSLTD